MKIEIDGHVLLLDDSDAHLVHEGRLTVAKAGFARCGQRAVHVLVTGAKHGQRVKAIDGNLLNCSRQNLRLQTPEELQAQLERLALLRQKRVEMAKAAASQATKVPADIGTWGVLKTRCWEVLFHRLTRSMTLKHPRISHLEEVPKLLTDLPNWTDMQCGAFLYGCPQPDKPHARTFGLKSRHVAY